ncbi:hypothetical protein J437_LFUL002725 [Ladona fulva]|uniref:Peptidase M24 domain-containing protein n=1 Tax=Ladona fulva TaxID=123851 RepID=A0A8K0K1T5_LADFU|nr:hypothetical protein J437_LFUL002725 [Ladona fulva]
MWLILILNEVFFPQLGREVLDEAAKVMGVGVTTDEVDRVVHEACIERECYPSPLNYYEFPRSCCTSVNEVICHGIPDLRPLQDGDICNGEMVPVVFHFPDKTDFKGFQTHVTKYRTIENGIKNKAVGIMKYGHCFTIEPMISEGNWRDELWPDRWTAVTVDGMLSAQFEHTLLVTDRGCEILTARRSNNGQPYFMDKL